MRIVPRSLKKESFSISHLSFLIFNCWQPALVMVQSFVVVKEFRGRAEMENEKSQMTNGK